MWSFINSGYVAFFIISVYLPAILFFYAFQLRKFKYSRKTKPPWKPFLVTALCVAFTPVIGGIIDAINQRRMRSKNVAGPIVISVLFLLLSLLVFFMIDEGSVIFLTVFLVVYFLFSVYINANENEAHEIWEKKHPKSKYSSNLSCIGLSIALLVVILPIIILGSLMFVLALFFVFFVLSLLFGGSSLHLPM